ncbi:hypothetical protein LXA43DRAFT_1097397 [Ganoderma leucocontextum]|nr:hypothetical protein LXA43DRAFT_1097397 [Ganoderma leucocontextum]
MPIVADSRLIVWRSDFKETKNSLYCPVVRQLCHVDATNRIPPAPAKCPSCDHAYGTFGAFLTYKAEQAGMWLFKCMKCQNIYRPQQLGPSPVIVDAIRKQLEANAIADCEAASQREEDQALKIALVQSKREAKLREKALLSQEKALMSVERMRTQAHREHEKDVEKATRVRARPANNLTTSKVSSAKGTPGENISQRIKVLHWFKADEPTLSFEIDVIPSEPFLLSDHQIFADMCNGVEKEVFAWGINLHAWNHAMEPITMDANTRVLLVRQDFIGHCLGFGTELRVLQAMRSSYSYTKTLAADKAKKKEILTQVVHPDLVRVVFWPDNHQTAMEDTVIKIDQQSMEGQEPSASVIFNLRFYPPAFELLRARQETAIDVYLDNVSDWERFPIRANIPIDVNTHTVLIRIPGVEGMPHLGVEIEALRTPRTIPQQKQGKHARKEPSGPRGRKRQLEEEEAMAYLAQYDTRSRSSSVESWHPGDTVSRDASAGASSSKTRGCKETSGRGKRAVLGERNAKKVKLTNSDVQHNWEGAETVVDGRPRIDLGAL